MTENDPFGYGSDTGVKNPKKPRKDAMAIYELFDSHEEEIFEEHKSPSEETSTRRFFSTLVTRFCFLFLLVADMAWFAYNSILLLLLGAVHLITARKLPFLRKWTQKTALNFLRSAACGLALLVGLFSPPFGIMIACTYFLMYDKAGMDEVVPAPLQSQFKDIFKV